MFRRTTRSFRTEAPLPRWRAALAFLVAVMADVIQLGLGPLGIFWVDDLLDLAVAVVEIALLGFHPLLLPTFVLEVLPGLEMMPTWTACVLAIITFRQRKAGSVAPQGSPGGSTETPPRGPVIDV